VPNLPNQVPYLLPSLGQSPVSNHMYGPLNASISCFFDRTAELISREENEKGRRQNKVKNAQPAAIRKRIRHKVE
jgi:hypothetical protein